MIKLNSIFTGTASTEAKFTGSVEAKSWFLGSVTSEAKFQIDINSILNFELLEDGYYWLLEDGSKIILE